MDLEVPTVLISHGGSVNHWHSSTSSTPTLDCSKGWFLFVLLCFYKRFICIKTHREKEIFLAS